MSVVPGTVEQVEVCRVLILSYVEIENRWLQVLDVETRSRRTWLWLDVIEEPVSFPSRYFIDVCYRLYPKPSDPK